MNVIQWLCCGWVAFGVGLVIWSILAIADDENTPGPERRK